MSSLWVTAAEADRALIEYTHRHGYPDLSGRQLKRWRSDGLLPHREVRGNGRGAGVRVRDPALAGPQLVALCAYRERFAHSTAKLAASLWYDGWEVPSQRIREAAAEHYSATRRRGEASGKDLFERTQHEASARTRSFSEAERTLIADLPGRFKDPAGERRPGRELVGDARTDLIGSMLARPGTYAADEELVTAYLQLDRLDEVEGRPVGHSLRRLTPELLDFASLDHVVSVTENASEADLERVRTQLRSHFEMFAAVRDEDLGRDMPFIEKWLPTVSTPWDTRDPHYDPRQLLVAIGSMLLLAPLFASRRVDPKNPCGCPNEWVDSK